MCSTLISDAIHLLGFYSQDILWFRVWGWLDIISQCYGGWIFPLCNTKIYLFSIWGYFSVQKKTKAHSIKKIKEISVLQTVIVLYLWKVDSLWFRTTSYHPHCVTIEFIQFTTLSYFVCICVYSVSYYKRNIYNNLLFK